MGSSLGNSALLARRDSPEMDPEDSSFMYTYLSRVYVFWCIYWRRVVIVVRIQILVIQFQVPNPIASTTALPATVATNAPASTAAPSGRNKHFREKWLSALKGKM